jgi:NADP-dependent 3-hydroxy acid dehydrogenase YdfG
MSAHLEQAGPNAWQQAAHDIIVLGSTVGRHISPFSAMYGGTKFAVAAMAEALRRELAPKGIRVGLIEPGIVKSEFQSVAGYDADGFGKLMDEKGPVLVPDDIADLVLHMASLPPRICLGDVVIRGTRQDYP